MKVSTMYRIYIILKSSKMKSNFFTLNARDFFKGLVVALITAVITFLYEAIAAGKPLDLALFKSVGMIALSAGLAYVLKNLGTNSQGQMLTTEKNATPMKVAPIQNASKILILAVIMSGIGITAHAQDGVSIWKPVPKNLFQVKSTIIKTTAQLATPGMWLWRFQAAIVATELTYDKLSKQWQSSALDAVGPGVGYRYYTTNADGTLINTFGFNFLLLLGTNMENISIASIKPALTVSAFDFLNVGVDYNIGNSKIGLLLGATVTF